MSKIVARIQAHPSRESLHGPLAKALAPLTAAVSLHASNPPNPWEGYQKCLRDIPECTHLLVLQDDVVLCKNFPPAVTRVADANPDYPVILFLAWLPRRVSNLALRAAKNRQHYFDARLRINEFCPAVAVLWPAAKVEEFLAWTDANPGKLGHPAPRSDDGVIGRWVALTKQIIRFTIPSLVQHPDLESSLIGRKMAWGKDRGRVALFFSEDDPLTMDWATPP